MCGVNMCYDRSLFHIWCHFILAATYGILQDYDQFLINLELTLQDQKHYSLIQLFDDVIEVHSAVSFVHCF